jgi:predicted Zn-dependent peptidase
MRPLQALAPLLIVLGVPVFAATDSVKFPPYHRSVLPNGVTLLLMEKHNAPLVSFTIALKTGSASDPAGKEGLADLTNDLLRKGAGARSAKQISEELDFVGASLGTSTTIESSQVSAEFMKKDVQGGLDLVSDMLLHPTFPADEVTKMLKQRADSMKAAKDRPLGVIGSYYNGFLFGSHPYGRPPGGDEVSVLTLTRDNVVRCHAQNYVASNLVIAVCGDFAPAEMEKALASHFGGLPKKDAPAVTIPPPEPARGVRLLLVDKPDATQTFFRFGNLGIAVNDPDRVAVDVVNTLFGGRFTSWINTALRIDSGLTYGAGSSFTRHRQPGAFQINTYTRNATTELAMDMALKVLGELHEKGLTEEQLNSAKQYLKGQFGPRVESSDQLAGWLIDFELNGMDAREVDEYAARLDAVTLADVKRVIEKDYPSKDLVFTVIGKASEIAPLMKKYSTQIETRGISDPGYRAGSGARE